MTGRRLASTKGEDGREMAVFRDGEMHLVAWQAAGRPASAKRKAGGK